MECQIRSVHQSSFFFSSSEDERMTKWSGQAHEGNTGRGSGAVAPAPAALIHALSIIHRLRLPPLFCHSPSPLLPPTLSFHPRPTFPAAAVVVVGVAIRDVAQCEEHKTEVGQILHAARITPGAYTHTFSLSLSPPLSVFLFLARCCCSLNLHLKFVFCLSQGPLCLHILSVSTIPL